MKGNDFTLDCKGLIVGRLRLDNFRKCDTYLSREWNSVQAMIFHLRV